MLTRKTIDHLVPLLEPPLCMTVPLVSLVGKKRVSQASLDRPSKRWGDNIKIDPRETGCDKEAHIMSSSLRIGNIESSGALLWSQQSSFCPPPPIMLRIFK